MTAMPPEPDFSPQGTPGMAPEPPTVQRPVWPSPAYQPAGQPSAFQQPAYQPSDYQPPAFAPPPVLPPPPDPSARDLAGPPLSRRLSPIRIITGVMWGAIAVICAVGAVLELSVGVYAGAVVCLIVAIGAGWYDYRVWRFKARRYLL